MRTLYLVVEILSPSSVKTDRFTKRRLYQEQDPTSTASPLHLFSYSIRYTAWFRIIART